MSVPPPRRVPGGAPRVPPAVGGAPRVPPSIPARSAPDTPATAPRTAPVVPARTPVVPGRVPARSADEETAEAPRTAPSVPARTPSVPARTPARAVESIADEKEDSPSRSAPVVPARTPAVPARTPMRSAESEDSGPAVDAGPRTAPVVPARTPARTPEVSRSVPARTPMRSSESVTGGELESSGDSRFVFSSPGPVPAWTGCPKLYTHGNRKSKIPILDEGGDAEASPVAATSSPSVPSRTTPASTPSRAPIVPSRGTSEPPVVPARTPDVPSRAEAPSRAPARTAASPLVPARTPAVPARTVPARGAVAKTAGGGGDTIASLEAELQEAINNQRFELCGPIRDKINALKNAPPAEAAAADGLDEAAYAAAVAKIEADMQAAIVAEAYENCASLRDKKKKLEELRQQYDANPLPATLTALNAKIEQA